MRPNALLTSPSMPGVIWSRYSTTVTSVPRRAKTEPISSPITPAPITAMVLGIALRDSAPVEVTITSSSMVTPGRVEACEPEAITMARASCVSPFRATWRAAGMEAKPLSQSILFFLNRNSMPWVFPAMVSSL
jgi:hypothetical protein